MGLLNTQHSTLTQSVIDLQADLLKNPFYLFNDKKGIPVEYYNLNKSRTTLDEGLKITYDDYGPDSSLRFNLIHNFYIYGLDRITSNLESGEFGISSGEINGEAVILPDTIQPFAGDNFVINMVKKRYQFLVTSVSNDTFDNGGNYWKIEYKLYTLNAEDKLNKLVVDEFNFISGNVGTQYNPILQKSRWSVCKNLDDTAVMLKKLFRGLYFNERVQTYTFVYLYRIAQACMNSDFFYDPYLIEFCIKNKILSNSGEKYEYIDHKTFLRPEFGIKYSRSIWRVIEARDKNELSSCKHSSAAMYIDDPGTIFGTRYENYFELTYNDPDTVAEMFAPAIDIIDQQVIGHILENQLFMDDSKYAKYNLLIKYFNYSTDIGVQDMIPLERIVETENNSENYFLIPMLIYVIEFYIKNLMAREPESSQYKLK